MDDKRDEIRFEPVGPKGVSRAVPIVTFLVGIFLGAAFVKPWDIIFPATPTPTLIAQVPNGSASPSVAVVATPAPSPTPAAPAECAFAGGWRVFALGQRDRLGGDGSTIAGADASIPPDIFADIGNPLRRWLEVAPLETAVGPNDDHVPFVTIVSERIAGIGYCPPPDDVDTPPTDAVIDAWSVDAAGVATPVPLQLVDLGPSATIEVKVYIGTAEDPTGRGRWAPGRYVFAIGSPTENGYHRWFGVEIRTPPGRPPA